MAARVQDITELRISNASENIFNKYPPSRMPHSRVWLYRISATNLISQYRTLGKEFLPYTISEIRLILNKS